MNRIEASIAEAGINRVRLSGDASSENLAIVDYRIYRGNTLLAQQSTTTFEDVNLMPGTTYQYTITAVDKSEATASGFFVGDASSGRPFGELMVDELRLGTGYRSVIPRIPNPLDSDKDDLEDTVESNTGVFVSEADPDIGGFTLNLDLWVSNELSTWSLLPLTEEDVRGTERGVEVSLPLPTDETFYRFEFDRP